MGEVKKVNQLDSVEDLEQLYDANKGLAYGLAFQMLRDQGAAEDVVQDAFLAAWRSRCQYDPGKGGIRSWLLSIVRNRAIDRLRHDRLRPEDALELETDVLYDTTMDPAQLGPERMWIRDALASLPDAQRIAVKLAYFGGFTQTQIARRTGQPLGTVKGQLRLGLSKLAGLELARFGTIAK